MSAAAEAGIRITLLDTLYLHGGLTDAGYAEPIGSRSGGSAMAAVDAWIERVAALEATDTRRIGAAIHSVRAVDPDAIGTVARWAADTGAVVHAHVSEQPAENEACLAASRSNTDRGARRRRRALRRGSRRCTPPIVDRRRHRRARRGRFDGGDVPDHRTRPGRRHRPDPRIRRGRRADGARIRLARGDRPVRGSARARTRRTPAQPAAWRARGDRPARHGDRQWAPLPRVGRCRHDRGRSSRRPRVRVTRIGAHGGRSRRGSRSKRRCSRRAPAMSPTWSSTADGSSPTGDTSRSTSPPNCTPPSRS